jgi:hypothetical protein
MSQSYQSVVALSNVLGFEEPECIIEFGTGRGGLTALFGIYGWFGGAKIHSLDIKEPLSCIPAFSALGIEFHLVDIFSEYAQEKISSWINNNGKVLLFCDNGKKKKEFNVFAPMLKVGDIIMAHDYAETKEVFIEQIAGTHWGCHEIQYSDIEQTVKNCGLVQLYEEVCDVGALCCFKKRK